MEAQKNSTASKCRFMIGKTISDWRKDRCNGDKKSYEFNKAVMTEIHSMLRFARRIHAIDDSMDSILWSYTYVIMRNKKCAE